MTCKKESYRLIRYFVPVFVIAVLLLAPGLQMAQKDFNMTEKETVRKFKMSNGYFLKAQEKFIKNKFAKALTLLDKCLDTFPDHDRAHFLKASIYLKQKNLAKAQEHITLAKNNFLIMKKWYAFTYQQYLESLRKQKQKNMQTIDELMNRASQLTGSERMKLINQAETLKGQNGTIDSKLNEHVRTGEEIPADYFYIQGNIYFLSRKHQQAFREYQNAIKSNPNHANSYNNLANLYFMVKRFDKAKQYLDKAAELGAPVNPKFRKALEKALKN